MTRIRFNGRDYDLADGTTVLDGLLSQGVDLPYSCRSGTCQTCMIEAEDKSIPLPPVWQAGLKDVDRARGYLLACQCRPTEDLALRALDLAETAVPAVIIAKRPLNETVVALHLRTDAGFTARAGQYVTLFLAEDLGRSYSIANIPELEGYIEIHVRRIPGGRVSGWAHDQAAVGDRVSLRGPSGSCFYVEDVENSYPILLAGTGTGLAPLYGILQDALRRGHRGDIHIVHGALRSGDLYYRDELRRLADSHPGVSYTPCVLDPGDAANDVVPGSLDEVAVRALRDPKSTRAYFCGAPEMVAALKKKAFLAGVASRHIHSDPFLPTRSAAAA